MHIKTTTTQEGERGRGKQKKKYRNSPKIGGLVLSSGLLSGNRNTLIKSVRTTYTHVLVDGASGTEMGASTSA